MADYVVESIFKHEGFLCAVILHKMGHRCGYVALPKTHPLYGKDYEKADRYVSVHGGLTYSDNNHYYPIESFQDFWWIGFDCAHWGDARDYDAAMRLIPEHAAELKVLRKFDSNEGTIKTMEYVKAECKSLAEQLKEMRGT